MDKETKKWIDCATYGQLYRRRRFGKLHDPIFQGEAGKYYAKIMRERRDQVHSLYPPVPQVVQQFQS